MNGAGKNSILVVDDENSNILALTHILSSEYIVYAAKNGENAIKAAEKYLPDIILLDIIMPDMDGYAVMTALKSSEKTKDIPVIFVTGLSSTGDEEKGLALGTADYITKPFSPAIVRLRVNNQIKLLVQLRAINKMVQDLQDTSAQLKNLLGQSTAASLAKSSFLANISHEMRTPMNVVVGLTDLMLDEENPSTHLKDNLRKISIAGKTLLGLVNDVLDISKIEAGKLELIPVEYEVPSLLNDIITLNMIRIEDKPITFVLDILEDLPCHLYGDDLRVKQIINNLLSNAFKYTSEGTVTLGMSCQPDLSMNAKMLLSFYVSDTGIGIREEDLQKLFIDYSQADIQTNREIEGTGLGLSITKQLTEMMDGGITAESKYGKGTTFRVCIQQGFVSDTKIGEETAENLRSFSYKDKRKRASEILVRPNLSYANVLVVDDLQTNLDVAVGLLSKYKMHVDGVLSGEEAVSRIIKGQPVYDAIFMDYMMPEMDGIESMEKIRAIGTQYAMSIPIIVLTANAIAENEQMFLNKGFQAFLTKPINIINLDYVVQKWIRDKAENRQIKG